MYINIRIAKMLHVAVVSALTLMMVRPSHASPNIIYILMDDMGNSDMSARGGEFGTPNLDDLYYSSINLRSHYSGLLCSPARSQILTGRYAWNFGYSRLSPFGYLSLRGIPLGVPTIGNLLKEYTNYDTYAVGKWHVGYSTWEHTPTHRGFDEFYGFFVTGISYVILVFFKFSI